MTRIASISTMAGRRIGRRRFKSLTWGTTPLYSISNPNPFGGTYSNSGDNFGYRVDVLGNYAIVGAPYEDDGTYSQAQGWSSVTVGNNSGRAFIFNVTTGALVHTLNNPNAYNTAIEDWFGISVAISDNYAIVGARLEDDAGGTSSGKAYIFNVTTGALVHTLDNPNAYNTSASDGFGNSVAISGNYAIVGAFGEDDVGGTSSGKAYIFNVTTGSLVHTLDNPNPYGTSASDAFGNLVAMSGNYAIVGTNNEDDAGGTTSGKAYIYNVTTGTLLYTLNNPNAYDTSQGDNFGVSVAISGNYAIVGATGEDDTSGVNSGKAYIFDVTTGALVYTLDNPSAYGTSQSDQFGISVGISDNYAIVGAYAEDYAGGTNSGTAYIFDLTTGSLLHTLDNPTPEANDYFGFAVATDGNYAIIGAYREYVSGQGLNQGAIYIYNAS